MNILMPDYVAIGYLTAEKSLSDNSYRVLDHNAEIMGNIKFIPCCAYFEPVERFDYDEHLCLLLANLVKMLGLLAYGYGNSDN